MKNDLATEQLTERKAVSRAYLRSLPLEEKIARLIDLQEQYYSMLALRDANGGKAIPEKWKKWRAARSSSKK